MGTLLPIVKQNPAQIGHHSAGVSMFATKLKALRKEKGWTKAELSRRSGIPSRTLSAYESGDIEDPSWSHVRALCRAFEVSCDHFNESEDEKK